VKYPQIVSHYNLEAKIYKGKDGYHAIWHAAGKRKKRQFKKLKDAKEAALKALKLIHKGQGAAANLSGTELDALINTKKLLNYSSSQPRSFAHFFHFIKRKMFLRCKQYHRTAATGREETVKINVS
jgi:hypothetical protein